MKKAAYLFILLFGIIACGEVANGHNDSATQSADTTQTAYQQPKYPVQKTDAEWKKELTPNQYYILRQSGTEPAFSGKYWDFHGDGIFVCAACGQPLFDSKTKFKSGTGWPSFYDYIKGGIVRTPDKSFGMTRTELKCARCGGHLGHVFDDGPQPTGLRYCIDSGALKFIPRAQADSVLAKYKH